MQLTDFLSRVLPTSGLTTICYPRPKQGFKHQFYEDKEEAASAASTLDSRGEAVYFGCASYQTSESRKAENVAKVRSFWLDIDAGDDKPYTTGRDAARAVLKFAEVVGLPQPLLVSSGRGIHAYWPMADDMAPSEWLPVAQKLKTITKHVGLDADPSRTSDVASVLRPVGTYHRKAEPKLVKVVLDGEATTLAEFETALDAYLDANSIELDLLAAGGSSLPSDLNSDLSGGMEYPPANAQRIADNCAVVGLVRDVQGNVDQPTWYHTLQILAHCEKSEQLAHEWSMGHPNYSADETDLKLKQAGNHKPTTCEKFNDHQGGLCSACPHFGKIKSPIVLGMGAPQQTVTVPAAQAGQAPKALQLPKGYEWDGNIVWRLEEPEDEDSGPSRRPITDTLLLFTERYDLDEDGMAYLVEYVRQGEIKKFQLLGSLINRGGSELCAELGKHEVGLMAKPHDVQRFLQAWMAFQKEKLQAKKMHQHFGWQELPEEVENPPPPNFLLGPKLFKPGLGKTDVLLKANALKRAKALNVRGDYDKWKHVIDRAYNHAGMEPLQFLVLCGIAAPIFAMFGNLGGVTVFAHSGKSGRGKSTACHAALSVWGDWTQMILANKQATINAFWTITGTYHNLPIVYDELTNMEPSEASDLIYGITQGRPRERLGVNGQERDNNSSWRTILLATGNNMMSEKLSSHRADATPEMARLFEFSAYTQHVVKASEADALFRELLDNHGHAGDQLAEYLVDNYEVVEKGLMRWRERIVEHFEMRNDERFWSALFASVMMGLTICRRLDILQFDPKAMLAWIGSELDANRTTQTAHVSGAKQNFSRMLSDLTPGIIETENIGDVIHNRPATVSRYTSGPIVGRSIVEDRIVWLSTEAVRQWCVARKISAREMMREIVSEGWVNPTIAREALGRGTLEYSSQGARTSVYVVDMSRVESDREGASAPRKPVAVGGSGSDADIGRAAGSHSK